MINYRKIKTSLLQAPLLELEPLSFEEWKRMETLRQTTRTDCVKPKQKVQTVKDNRYDIIETAIMSIALVLFFAGLMLLDYCTGGFIFG